MQILITCTMCLSFIRAIPLYTGDTQFENFKDVVGEDNIAMPSFPHQFVSLNSGQTISKAENIQHIKAPPGIRPYRKTPTFIEPQQTDQILHPLFDPDRWYNKSPILLHQLSTDTGLSHKLQNVHTNRETIPNQQNPSPLSVLHTNTVVLDTASAADQAKQEGVREASGDPVHSNIRLENNDSNESATVKATSGIKKPVTEEVQEIDELNNNQVFKEVDDLRGGAALQRDEETDIFIELDANLKGGVIVLPKIGNTIDEDRMEAELPENNLVETHEEKLEESLPEVDKAVTDSTLDLTDTEFCCNLIDESYNMNEQNTVGQIHGNGNGELNIGAVTEYLVKNGIEVEETTIAFVVEWDAPDQMNSGLVELPTTESSEQLLNIESAASGKNV